MSFPDAFAHDIVLGPDQVLPTVPRDFGERFTLNWKAARAPDKWWFYDTRMMELWDDALDQLQKATGQNFVNPYRVRPDGAPAPWRPGSAPAPEWQRRLETTDRSTAIDAALKAFDQAREGQFDLPDPRRFEDRVRAESVKLRQDAEKSALASYGAGGLGAFLGAAAGELSHPVNVATLPLGGEYAIANVARMGLLKFLGRNALVEGGVAAVSQTAIEAMDAPIQERLATDTGIGDRVERVLTAGVGGAILGLGLSGLVAAVRGARFRGRMALDEADALKVAERNVYAAERNPLGPDGINAHAKALDTAEVQVSAGRHADTREIVAQEVRQQIVAYHGSPHRFDRFSAERIGTGEGAQAFGYGLYFAEARAVAAAYARDLVGRSDSPRDIAARLVEAFNGDRAAAIAEIDRRLGDAPDGGTPDFKRGMAAAKKAIREGDYGGFLYEVRINASREDFIDLDKPLREQGERVQQAFGYKRHTITDEMIAAARENGRNSEAEFLEAQRRGFDGKADLRPGEVLDLSLPEVTARFREAGIPGIKYLDQGSRDVGAGSYNYVVFDDRLVEITSREGAEPFDLLDSAAATRPIAKAAPVPPEKPPTGMKEAKADEARAMVIQKDFEVSMPDGTKRMASEIMAEADESVKAAKLAAECAAGGAIG